MDGTPQRQQGSPAISRRELVVVTLASCVTIAVAFGIGPRGYAYSHTWEYMKMIEGAFSDAPAPFAYRVLVPALLKFIPLAPRLGFFLVTCAATLLTMVGMFVLLRALQVAFRPSLFAAQFVGLSYPVALYLAYWGMVDPVANFLVVLTLLGLVWNRWTVTSAAICLGSLTKETNLLLLPLFAWRLWRRGRRGWGPRLGQAFLVLVPVLITALLRSTIHPVPGKWDLQGWGDLTRFWKALADDALATGPLVLVAAVFLRSYGFHWITATLGVRHQREWRGICAYLLLAGSALCAVAGDWSRMLGFGFAGIFIPTAFMLEHLESGRHARRYLVLLTAFTVLQCWITLAGISALSAPLARLHKVATGVSFLAGALTAMLGYRAATVRRDRARRT